MGDVRVPNCWQLGDAVVCRGGGAVGIIIELIQYGDMGDMAVVYWPSGVDNVSCGSLFPAFR